MECLNDPILFNEEDTTVLTILTALHEFRLFYRMFHKYISIVLCLLGLFVNSMHIWVLTRPKMLYSPVHTVLIFIAIADIGTMSSYTVYLVRFEFGSVGTGGYSYFWVFLLKIHVMLSIALHAISLYLVVFMAYIRLCSIRTHRSHFMNSRITGFASFAIAIAIFTLCIPTLLAHDIVPQPGNKNQVDGNTTAVPDDDADAGSTQYSIGFSKMVTKNNCFLLKLNLWMIGILLKVVPCVLLLLLTYGLLMKLHETRKKRQLLLRDRAKEGVYRDRTTYMLLVMVALFLCTELPQGIIAILNAIYTAQFHFYVYITLADILDVLSLINCYVGFTVFFCTCSTYRQTFFAVLAKTWCSKWIQKLLATEQCYRIGRRNTKQLLVTSEARQLCVSKPANSSSIPVENQEQIL